MSDDLTIAYMLGVEDMRSRLHKQADEIERLRAEIKQADELMFNQAQSIRELAERTEQLGFFQIKINDRIYFVSEGVGKEIEKLRQALSAILNDVGYHNPMRMTTEISDKILEDAAGALND